MSPPDARAARIGAREQLVMRGARSLSDAELVAVVLGTGCSGQPVAVLAAHLLQRAGGVHGLDRLGVNSMSAVPGIGHGKACRLLAALELGTRRATRPLERGEPVSHSADVDAAMRPRLRNCTREHFFAVALDVKNRPIAEIEVAVGGLSACAITPADAFRPVLREAASCVIFAHNHPSGVPNPSDEDVAMTHRLVAVGDIVGVRVLDHIIVGSQGYFSFLDAGLLRSSTA